jgi:raffinose/stachyose/melibiose transport system permease protein
MNIRKIHLGRFSLEIVMLILSIVMLSPIMFQIISSFKNRFEINRPLSFPSSFYMENYYRAIVDGHFFQLLQNSVLVAVLTMFVVVIISVLASYPLARNSGLRYKLIYFFFLSGIMVPFQAGMIPLYQLINWLQLTDNQLSLVLIYAGGAIPMSVLIYAGFIRTVPAELEEAAQIDGCGPVRSMIQILFPLLKPATVSVIVLNIIPIWNDFLTPLIFLSSIETKTLPVGMWNFIGLRTSDYGPIFAFSVLTSIIPIVMFLLLQKHFYKGITAGAVKG